MAQTAAMARRFVRLVNNTPVFGWALLIVWTGMLAVFSGLVFIQGLPDDIPGPVGAGALLLFWAAGLAATAHVLRTPRTQMTVDGGWVVIRKAWLFRRTEQRFALRQCSPPRFVCDQEAGGDPYFRLLLTTPAGDEITLAEHHLESEVRTARDRLLQAMRAG